MKITLKTKRLTLRPFECKDSLEMYNNWASDPEVSKFLTWSPHQNINETEKLLSIWIDQYQKEERINFAITLTETNELIGGIDVVGYLDGVPVLGYVLSRKYWSQGYMSEACNKVIEFLFTLGHNKIIIDAICENIASNKVILKCGGRFIETYQDYFKNKNKNFNINRYYIEKVW